MNLKVHWLKKLMKILCFFFLNLFIYLFIFLNEPTCKFYVFKILLIYKEHKEAMGGGLGDWD